MEVKIFHYFKQRHISEKLFIIIFFLSFNSHGIYCELYLN
jgi:hypothetical protein